MQEADLALHFIRPVRALGFPYLVTGSIAAIVYGEPRLTHDLDLVVALAEKDITLLAAAFSDESFYCPPLDVMVIEARREQRGHIDLIHLPTGFKADFYLAGRDPFHAWAFQRTREVLFQGEAIRIAPPEYVIIRKLEFLREGASEKHLRDIRLMLKVSGDSMDQKELVRRISDRGLTTAWSRVLAGT